jgi:hypothetical protein
MGKRGTQCLTRIARIIANRIRVSPFSVFIRDCKNHPEQAALLRKVVNEFERQSSGLILPDGLVVKRFEGDRILRVTWKIVRGLYFSHFGTFVPDDLPKGCELVSPDHKPPDSFFKVFSSGKNYGRHPGVFDYTFKSFPEFHNLNYWAMLLWDRLILMVKFQHPPCNCIECSETKEKEKQPACNCHGL